MHKTQPERPSHNHYTGVGCNIEALLCKLFNYLSIYSIGYLLFHV